MARAVRSGQRARCAARRCHSAVHRPLWRSLHCPDGAPHRCAHQNVCAARLDDRSACSLQNVPGVAPAPLDVLFAPGARLALGGHHGRGDCLHGIRAVHAVHAARALRAAPVHYHYARHCGRAPCPALAGGHSVRPVLWRCVLQALQLVLVQAFSRASV